MMSLVRGRVLVDGIAQQVAIALYLWNSQMLATDRVSTWAKWGRGIIERHVYCFFVCSLNRCNHRSMSRVLHDGPCAFDVEGHQMNAMHAHTFTSSCQSRCRHHVMQLALPRLI